MLVLLVLLFNIIIVCTSIENEPGFPANGWFPNWPHSFIRPANCIFFCFVFWSRNLLFPLLFFAFLFLLTAKSSNKGKRQWHPRVVMAHHQLARSKLNIKINGNEIASGIGEKDRPIAPFTMVNASASLFNKQIKQNEWKPVLCRQRNGIADSCQQFANLFVDLAVWTMNSGCIGSSGSVVCAFSFESQFLNSSFHFTTRRSFQFYRSN